MGSLSLLATAYPAFSQNYNSTRDAASSVTSEVQNTQNSVKKHADNMGNQIDEAAGADNRAGSWSWIGLIGLLGLFGLKRHSDVHNANYRATRPS